MGAGWGLGEGGLKPGYKVATLSCTERLNGQRLPKPVLSYLSCRNKKDTRRRQQANNLVKTHSITPGDCTPRALPRTLCSGRHVATLLAMTNNTTHYALKKEG